MTPLEYISLAVAAISAAVAAAAWAARSKALRRAEAAEQSAESLRAAERPNEYRVDRFDLIWFPVVSYLEAEKLVTRASPGVPYCKACVKPLASQGGAWRCPGCSDQRPDSVVDTAATDSVMREAVRFFLQRHPDFRLSPDLQRLK